MERGKKLKAMVAGHICLDIMPDFGAARNEPVRKLLTPESL
jgi:hypothetical protein